MNACSVGADQLENISAIKRIQSKLGLNPDGWPGDLTWTKIGRALGVEPLQDLKPSGFPNEDYASMLDYYGRPGDESQLVRFRMPYSMRLYTRNAPATLSSHRCHRKVRDSLEGVLDHLLITYGLDWITENGLDVFGGVYNHRKKRSGRSLSKHSWGVAIDLNPAENALNTPWPSKATMPIEAVEAFEQFGWKSLGRLIGRDAMHFEATS